MQSASTQFGLIRHARTLWNEEKRIQGRLDSPLSPAGQRMARAWGRQLANLSWNRILASDLGRVQETAQLINETLHLNVHLDQRLREQDWGNWSGLSFPLLFSKYKKEVRKQEAAGWDFRPPGGELRRSVLARSMETLRDAQQRWPGEKILVVCHEGIIKCLLYHLKNRKFLPHEPRLLKGYQLHLLKSDGKTLSLTSLNHLWLEDQQP